MEKNKTILGLLRSVFGVMAVGMLLILNSCGTKDKMNVSDLVTTVPSSASLVAALNFQSLDEKSGGEFEKRFSGTWFFEGSPANLDGVEKSGILLFTDAYDTYMTFLLNDTPVFVKSVEKEHGAAFEDVDGVQVNGNIAISGIQTWVKLSGEGIDVKAIKNYSNLSESQSFASSSLANEFAESKHDVVLWTLLKNIAQFPEPVIGGGFDIFNMYSGMIFENPESVIINFDFEKGKLLAGMKFLNSKGEMAKYLLPADKLDIDKIKSLGGSAGLIAAFAAPKSLVKKVEKLASSFGGNLFGFPEESLKTIDGTIALAIGEPGEMPVNGVVTTDGKPSKEFLNALSLFGQTKVEDKTVRFIRGEVAGNLETDKAAEYLKGATMGVVIGGNDLEGRSGFDWMKLIAVTLSPEKSSLVLKVTVEDKDPSQNAILPVLNNFSH